MNKRFLCSLLLFVSACAFLSSTARAGETINMENTMTVNPDGDGTMTVRFRLSASQWWTWKQQYGDHPDVLYRNMRQTFARYALDRFEVQKDDVQRQSTVTMSFRGATRVRTDGTRAIEIPKDCRLLSHTDREWLFEEVQNSNGSNPYTTVLTITHRLQLPAEARNAQFMQGGTLAAQLVYDMPVPALRNSGFFWAGLALMAAGLVLGAVTFLSLRPAPKAAGSTPVTPASSPG